MGAEHSQLGNGETATKNHISFMINGQTYHAGPEMGIGPETLLVDYIRENAHLKGTKFMCREGGCGACLVSVKTRDPSSGEETIRAVNSCLTPIYSCDGCEITTVEHLGNQKIGYHVIQQRLAQFSGTQCGYCTSGQIMNMYSLKESKPELTQIEIEDCMDTNLCRCTGYRPILDAFKSFAVDAPEELKRKCGEFQFKACARTPQNPTLGRTRNGSETLKDFETFPDELGETKGAHLIFQSMGMQWVKAVDLQSAFMAIEGFQKSRIPFRIVAGNTGTGVYKNEGPYEAFLDINSIHVLTKVEVHSTNLILGGAVTISKGIMSLKKAETMSEDYKYANVICKHWKRVANTGIRNSGTFAGNLMMKHAHREFASDIFLILECIGAMLTIASSVSLQNMYTMQQFLELDMSGKVIISIHFPKLKGMSLRSFKIARRYQNSHSYINAAFLMKVDPTNNTVMEEPRIVYGGISPTFIHAQQTEKYLMGKMLNVETIQGAMQTLDKEIEPDMKQGNADPKYRKSLTQALLYKAILGLLGGNVGPMTKSGSLDIERGLSYGKQTYDSDKTQWPMYEPVKKLEAAFQCSGEAEYIDDMELLYGELHGAMILATLGNADLKNVDPSEALKIPGVRGVFMAKDIPGVNNYASFSGNAGIEPVFAEKKVTHAGQAIGILVADTRQIALKAAKLVKIEYENIQKPIIDISTALQKLEREGKLKEYAPTTYETTTKFIAGAEDTATMKIKGEFSTGGQHHMHLENQICICVPKEDYVDVYSSTQSPSHAQNAVATVLKMPLNSVNVFVKRIGGAFGAKLMKASHVAAACAIGAQKLNRPVRLNLDMETNLSMIGKRLPYLFKYEVTVDETGKILDLQVNFHCDNGNSDSEPSHFFALLGIQNVYKANSWKVIPGYLKTNLTPNTPCRAPGTPQGVACMEYIMEHIAFTLKKDPLEVRMVNFINKGDPYFPNANKILEYDNFIPKMMEELKVTADLEVREKFIENFNKTNRWKKRGLSIIPTKVGVHFFRSNYKTYIAVYYMDGTVAVMHSGIEMGQGINTKVAQTVAKCLNLPLEKIKIKTTNSLIGANGAMTGLSVTSEFLCHSAVKACEILLERLAPVREKLGNPTWEELIAECRKQYMDLTSSYVTTPADKIKDYDCWGLTASEVEVDCLTGESKIVRVDLINDCGFSLNPDVDIGQIEGAFVMSCGMWLMEKMNYDQNTGQILTNRTWTYKPPFPKDIPEHFRITLMKNVPNPYGVLRSKAVAEPPMSMGFSVFLAVRKAIVSCRADAGNMDWFPMSAPLTPEDIQRFCLIEPSQFVIT